MNNKKKIVAVVISILLLVSVVVGGSLAFLIDTTPSVKNTFEPTKITTSVEEEFNNGVKTNVKIRNTGTTDAYIRAMVVITWKDANGNVCGETPVAGTDYTIDPYAFPSNLPNGWFKGSDNFYYYKTPVAANGTTGNLINKIESSGEKVINGTTYYLNVEILASGIQSEPAAAVEEAWPAVEVSTVAATKGQLVKH